MERYWTKVGQEFTKNLQKEISEIIEHVEWKALPCEMAAMPGLAIKEAIKFFHIQKVARVGTSHELAPYGLEAIEANYKGGMARIYFLDRGSDLIPLVSDYYPDKEAQN